MNRIKEPGKLLQVVMGPRQVGKTTLVNQLAEVKSGDDQNRSGLSEFQKQFNPDKILLVGKSGLTIEEFLTLDPVSLFEYPMQNAVSLTR